MLILTTMALLNQVTTKNKLCKLFILFQKLKIIKSFKKNLIQITYISQKNN